ncbi:MAG: TetR/AcrR family transcriptional regulator [Robiginitomaculum sp.]|nr:TetR/AcrR family transcriptional regulator [Robiginitomaculum sp.]
MARPQAQDYDHKRQLILNEATRLFAQNGFHATSVTDIADACATSKSRLYHYFTSKEQVLYEILRGHAQSLSRSFLPILEDQYLDPAAKLEKFATHLLLKNLKFKANHKLILSEMDALNSAQRREVARLLRRPIEAISEMLVAINPTLEREKSMQFPIAMMFIGMINWTHTWFSRDGELSPEHFAKLLCDIFMNGFSSAALK